MPYLTHKRPSEGGQMMQNKAPIFFFVCFGNVWFDVAQELPRGMLK